MNPNPTIAIIDDEEFYRVLLCQILTEKGFDVVAFAAFEPFFDHLDSPNHRIAGIVVDRFVGNDDAVAQCFANSCRYYGFKGPIVLYSNFTDKLPENGSGFAASYCKSEAVPWIEIFGSLAPSTAEQ